MKLRQSVPSHVRLLTHSLVTAAAEHMRATRSAHTPANPVYYLIPPSTFTGAQGPAGASLVIKTNTFTASFIYDSGADTYSASGPGATLVGSVYATVMVPCK